jgi:hypothetical protein
MAAPRITSNPQGDPPQRNFTEPSNNPFGFPELPKKSKPLPANVQRLTDDAAKLSRDAERSKSEADEKIALAKQFQESLLRYQRAVDLATDRLVMADKECEAHKASIAAMEANDLVSRWGRGDEGLIPGQPSRVSQKLFDYSTINSLRAAVDDYARVRPILVSAITKAQSALDAFEQSNSL